MLSPEQREAETLRLTQRLEAHPRFRRARTILLYHALPDEVATKAWLARWGNSKQVLLPVVTGDDLEMRRYTGEDGMHTGAFGIREPDGQAANEDGTIELALVPGMAFDAAGHRLGRGKGYYDRLLARLRRHGTYIIGIGFDCQHVDAVPFEAHDIVMDEVL